MTQFSDIVYEVEGRSAVIRLNRPEKLNAFTYHTLAEVRAAVDLAVAEPAVVGIIVTGTGRAFSAGLDSQSLVETVVDGGNRPRSSGDTSELPGLFSYFFEAPKPIIGAINGVTVGGGFTLAAKCDVRICSTAASFSTIFMKRGLIAEHGMTWVLPHLVGPGAAFDLLLTSKRIDAAEAYRIGFADYVVEPDDLLPRARAYIDLIAASAAPLAIADSKKLIYRHLGMPQMESFREAEVVQWEAVARPDAAEGTRALIEKRDPVFAPLPRR
ncbi:MAG: enoyl-CoA hydratase [Anaerolinea sp.]|nr:enoyl-CoA hydratase [Anaerolinea sp.]